MKPTTENLNPFWLQASKSQAIQQIPAAPALPDHSAWPATFEPPGGTTTSPPFCSTTLATLGTLDSCGSRKISKSFETFALCEVFNATLIGLPDSLTFMHRKK